MHGAGKGENGAAAAAAAGSGRNAKRVKRYARSLKYALAARTRAFSRGCGPGPDPRYITKRLKALHFANQAKQYAGMCKRGQRFV